MGATAAAWVDEKTAEKKAVGLIFSTMVFNRVQIFFAGDHIFVIERPPE